MKACVLLGNTRERSNTKAVTKIFIDELTDRGAEVKSFALREKEVNACVGCDRCHSVLDSFGCVQRDDMPEIAEEILTSDILVLSTPIYTWSATPPMKAAMDRLYAFTKYPENAEEFNMLKGMRVALIATSGDECASNCDLLDETVRRFARFAGCPYLGCFAVQDRGYENNNRQEVVDGARAFAEKCLEGLTP